MVHELRRTRGAILAVRFVANMGDGSGGDFLQGLVLGWFIGRAR